VRARDDASPSGLANMIDSQILDPSQKCGEISVTGTYVADSQGQSWQNGAWPPRCGEDATLTGVVAKPGMQALDFHETILAGIASHGFPAYCIVPGLTLDTIKLVGSGHHRTA